MDMTTVVFVLGLAILPVGVAFILVWATPVRDRNDSIFSLVCLVATTGWLALFILWTRRGYGRRWRQFQARSWRQIAGRFDDGEIITMRKGGSKKIAGYQVWLGYDYVADGDQTGLYTLPFVGDFPSEEVAEKCRKRAANQEVAVRVSPRNSKHSCVVDEDVRLIIGEQN